LADSVLHSLVLYRLPWYARRREWDVESSRVCDWYLSRLAERPHLRAELRLHLIQLGLEKPQNRNAILGASA
jgi:hypothetical protein